MWQSFNELKSSPYLNRFLLMRKVSFCPFPHSGHKWVLSFAIELDSLGVILNYIYCYYYLLLSFTFRVGMQGGGGSRKGDIDLIIIKWFWAKREVEKIPNLMLGKLSPCGSGLVFMLEFFCNAETNPLNTTMVADWMRSNYLSEESHLRHLATNLSSPKVCH